jgi:hypothetical protein
MVVQSFLLTEEKFPSVVIYFHSWNKPLFHGLFYVKQAVRVRKKFRVIIEAKDVPSCQVSVTGLLWFAVDLAGAISFKSFMLNSSSCAF